MKREKKLKRFVAQEEEKDIRELYEDFQLQNRIKNLSEMTIRFYNQNLVHLFYFLDECIVNKCSGIDKKIVDDYILWLKDKNLKDTTINTYLRAARALLYYGMKEDYISKYEINLIKADKEQKEPYSEVEIKKLIKRINFIN